MDPTREQALPSKQEITNQVNQEISGLEKFNSLPEGWRSYFERIIEARMANKKVESLTKQATRWGMENISNRELQKKFTEAILVVARMNNNSSRHSRP